MAINIIGDVSPIVIVADPATVFNNMSFRPQTVEKHIYAGDTPTFNFQIKNAGVAQNLSGLSIGFGARVSPAPSSSFLFNVSPTVTNAANGLASVTLTAAQTQPAGQYVAEVSLWGPGTKLVAIQFPLVVDSNVT